MLTVFLSLQEEKIGALQGFADRLIQTRHYAAVEVAERRAAVLACWSQLKSQLGAWRGILGQSLSFQQFKREADEAEAWVGVKMQVASEDSYKDPTDLPVSASLWVSGVFYEIVCCSGEAAETSGI